MSSRIITYCLLLVLLFLSTQEIAAQSNPFICGIFFNANGIHIIGEDEIFWQSSDGTIWGGGGLSAGINVKKGISKKTYFVFELRYIQKGSIYEYTNQYATQSFEVLRFNYIEIPVMLGLTYKIKKRDYFFETGPAYAKLVFSEMKINELAYRTNIPDISGFYNYDLSWIGSLKFPINAKGKKNLLFGVRVSCSVFSIHPNYSLRNLDYGLQLEYLINN
jgi:hypothetical protein